MLGYLPFPSLAIRLALSAVMLGGLLGTLRRRAYRGAAGLFVVGVQISAGTCLLLAILFILASAMLR